MKIRLPSSRTRRCCSVFVVVGTSPVAAQTATPRSVPGSTTSLESPAQQFIAARTELEQTRPTAPPPAAGRHGQSDARRSHGPRPRAQPRARRRAPEPADVRPEHRAAARRPTGRRSTSQFGQRAARPAADQPVERRHHRPERHDDLQRRHRAGAAVGRRRRRAAVQQQQAGHVEHLRELQPDVQLQLQRDADPAAAARLPDRQHAAAAARHRDQPRHLRDPAARHDRDHARRGCATPTGSWSTRLEALEVARGSLDARRAARRRQPRARRGRHDGAARRRAGRSRSRHPASGRRAGRGHVAHVGARAQAPDRERHRRSALARVDQPDRPADVRARAAGRRRRRAQGARHAHGPRAGAQDAREQRRDAALPEQPAAAGGRPDGQLRHAGSRRHAVHPPGQRPRQHGHRHDSGRLLERVQHADRPRLPDVERAAERQLPAWRRAPPTRSTRARACSGTRPPRSCARWSCRWPPRSRTRRCRSRTA